MSAPAGSNSQDPYGNNSHQQNLFGGGNHSTSKKMGGNTFSDQKTPNGHPNTFLYRAHINLNELSSANQGEYQDPQGYNQNVSAFYNDEVEEQKGNSDSEQPLRLTNQKERDSSGFSRGQEIEMQNPIMQMMQMHQKEKYRFSNLS